MGAAAREGRRQRGVDNWSCERHGRDLWFLADGKVAVCIRFPNPRMADAADATGILVAGDPVALIRSRWLGGSPSDQGRIVCAQCSKSLEYWDLGRMLGVDCATRFAEPSVDELSEWSAKWAARWDQTVETEREPITWQDSVGRPGGSHEWIRDRNRHEQGQVHRGQQAQAKSPEQERIKQQQRAWADYWTPERARQAQARARELARQSSEDGIAD